MKDNKDFDDGIRDRFLNALLVIIINDELEMVLARAKSLSPSEEHALTELQELLNQWLNKYRCNGEQWIIDNGDSAEALKS